MPALPSVSKVLRVILRYAASAEGQALINRIFISYSGTAPSDSQLDTFAAVVGTAWDAGLKSLTSTQYTLQDVAVEDLSSPTAAVGFSDVNTSGTRAGDVLGAAVAAVIQQKVARRYRGGHPRVYLPVGVSTDLADADQWGSTFITNLLAGYATFLSDIFAGGWTAAGTLDGVNVSYYSGFTNHTYPSGRVRPIPTLRGSPVVDPVLQYAVNGNLASQRRRNGQKHLSA